MLLQLAQAGTRRHKGIQQISGEIPQIVAVFCRQNCDGVSFLVDLGAQFGAIGDTGGLPQILVYLDCLLLEVVVRAAVPSAPAWPRSGYGTPPFRRR